MIEFNEGNSAVVPIAQKSDRVSQPGVSQSGLGTSPSGTRESKTFPDNVSLPSGNISFAALQTRNDHLNATATTIRAANKILDDVAQVIGEKREEVTQYEKQYPPFQDQSSEKVEFLNSIAALKKQVDDLTLVPDNKELASIISDKEEQSSEKERSQFTLRQQEVHSGENGLNIASISSNATDSEISQFGRDLDTANQTLEGKRAELAQDAKTISHEIATSEKSLGKEILESEQEATQKSEEVKKVLSTLPDEKFGDNKDQNLLETLK